MHSTYALHGSLHSENSWGLNRENWRRNESCLSINQTRSPWEFLLDRPFPTLHKQLSVKLLQCPMSLCQYTVKLFQCPASLAFLVHFTDNVVLENQEHNKVQSYMHELISSHFKTTYRFLAIPGYSLYYRPWAFEKSPLCILYRSNSPSYQRASAHQLWM